MKNSMVFLNPKLQKNKKPFSTIFTALTFYYLVDLSQTNNSFLPKHACKQRSKIFHYVKVEK